MSNLLAYFLSRRQSMLKLIFSSPFSLANNMLGDLVLHVHLALLVFIKMSFKLVRSPTEEKTLFCRSVSAEEKHNH
jgi:hypothetical protein